MVYVALLFVAVVLNVVAQLLLKLTAKDFSLPLPASQKITVILSHPSFWGALLAYGISFILYFLVLSKLEVGRAYPISSVSAIILIAVISVFFLGESISAGKIIGIVLASIGVFLIFK
ncbi:MAG: SMR family transporter [Patescibacteria group bacterium]|jgi:multidrug transporter EmrE-like cation transporter